MGTALVAAFVYVVASRLPDEPEKAVGKARAAGRAEAGASPGHGDLLPGADMLIKPSRSGRTDDPIAPDFQAKPRGRQRLSLEDPAVESPPEPRR